MGGRPILGVDCNMAKEVREHQEPITDEVRGEIIIEVVTRTGGDLLCDPLRGLGIDPATLRSRWSKVKSPWALAGDSGLDALPAFPGMCVSLNISQRYVRIWDPFGDQRNQDRLATTNAILHRAGKEGFNPVPERKIGLQRQTEQMTKDNIATWLYWMQRMLGMWGDPVSAALVPGSANPDVPVGTTPDGRGVGGDPTINFDASSALGEPRTLSQMHEAIVFASKRGYARTVVEPAQ